jgi:hypothetical protein
MLLRLAHLRLVLADFDSASVQQDMMRDSATIPTIGRRLRAKQTR